MSDLCIIPARAILDRELTDTDIRLLCAIGTHTNPRGENCFAASRTLSDEAGIGRSTFFIAAKRLIDRGYVRKTRRKRPNGSDSSSVYDIVLDPAVESSQPDAGSPDESDQGSADRLDPHNESLNASSSSGLPFLLPEYGADFDELESRIIAAGGSLTAWRAEMRAALDGMHGPARTPAEISQAIRDFQAAGAECSLRLFRGYLRGNGAGGSESARNGQPSGKNRPYKPGWQLQKEQEDRDTWMNRDPEILMAVTAAQRRDPDWWRQMQAEAKAADRWAVPYAYDQLQGKKK